jgi:hypothetical protein
MVGGGLFFFFARSLLRHASLERVGYIVCETETKVFPKIDRLKDVDIYGRQDEAFKLVSRHDASWMCSCSAYNTRGGGGVIVPLSHHQHMPIAPQAARLVGNPNAGPVQRLWGSRRSAWRAGPWQIVLPGCFAALRHPGSPDRPPSAADRRAPANQNPYH